MNTFSFGSSLSRKSVGLFVLVFTSSVMLAACIPSKQSAVSGPSPAVDTKQLIPLKDEIKMVEVEGGSFYYKPNEIRIKKGEKVKVVMKSVSMMHDFVIDELNVKMPVTKAGETGTVEFVADKTGVFEYYCSVGQHRANGQVGKLIVEE